MNSRATPKFWKLYHRLPLSVQRRAQKAYQQWQKNPAHSGVHFKRVDEEEPIYSARISDAYRVLGILDQDTVIWFWIGTHDEYERLLK
jgi:mRNA-degrading endonuclease RelE of RelBE toxin-antitoxin system